MVANLKELFASSKFTYQKNQHLQNVNPYGKNARATAAFSQ